MNLFFRGFIWSFIFIGFLWTNVSTSDGADPRKMKFDPVDFDPPKAERIELPKGMILYLLEDHTLPLVNIQVMIKTGRIFDLADQVGLAGLTGSVMRRGGGPFTKAVMPLMKNWNLWPLSSISELTRNGASLI